ncbi:MAG: tetratricopeptide repeat protein [Planctomycetaceae bacterium]|nr:tetratricopeptide repeat protein [Planctomycetaceae bacterium]
MRPSFLQKIAGAFLQLLEAFSFVMRNIVGWPLKVIRSSFTRAVDQAKTPSLDANNRRSKRSWGNWFFLPLIETSRFLYRLVGSVISFPYRFIKHLLTHTKSEFLWCLPAMLALLLLVLVVTRVFAQNQQIQGQYREGLAKSMRAGDFELSKTYCQRLVSWGGKKHENDRFNLAICCMQTGDFQTGVQLLNELAPASSVGYEPAHRYKAILLGQRQATQKSSEMLEELYHHLQNSGDQSSERIQATYAFYHVQMDNLDQAIPFLRNAAQKNPIHYLTMAQLLQTSGKNAARLDALRDAEREYRALLLKNATDHDARINLAAALSQLDREPEAQKVLEQGRLLKNDPVINRALADFCAMLYDQSDDFSAKLKLIQQSLNYDINYLGAYQRLIQQFRLETVQSAEKATQIEELLLTNIATGEATPLAHFAMSSLKSIAGDREAAQFHIERAFSLDPRFGVIANNLAWMLANDEENPDLQRAFELASDVLERFPEDARFRDTYATILLKQGDFEQALTQFELILGSNANQQAIHQKLAIIYRQLEKPDLAKAHQKLATQAATTKRGSK